MVQTARLSDVARRVTKTRTNTMVYNNIRPSIYVSRTGEPGSFRCWNKKYNISMEIPDQLDIARQAEVFACDIEKCISANPGSFVGMAGYDKYDYIDSFFMVHRPPMVCDMRSRSYNTNYSNPGTPI